MTRINKYGEIEDATCSGCGNPIKMEWVACPHCGNNLHNNQIKANHPKSYHRCERTQSLGAQYNSESEHFPEDNSAYFNRSIWLTKLATFAGIILAIAVFLSFLYLDGWWPGCIKHDRNTWNALVSFCQEKGIVELACEYPDTWGSHNPTQFQNIITQRLTDANIKVRHLEKNSSNHNSMNISQKNRLKLVKVKSSGGASINYALQLHDKDGHTLWVGELYRMR